MVIHSTHSYSVQDWHHRYQQQARWTESMRRFIFNQVYLERSRNILDVGCGTGALAREIETLSSAHVYGLDIDAVNLAFASSWCPKTHLTQADAHDIPFDTASFDLTFCHFLLLWVNNPQVVLAEMARITRPGGFILALAEPDYAGRIDFPVALSELGEWQQIALSNQGAHPNLGRELAGLFHRTGLHEINAGVIGGHWNRTVLDEEWEMEWEVLQNDLKHLVSAPSESTVEALRDLDRAARENGERVLFVPTFYAYGRVPKA